MHSENDAIGRCQRRLSHFIICDDLNLCHLLSVNLFQNYTQVISYLHY